MADPKWFDSDPAFHFDSDPDLLSGCRTQISDPDPGTLCTNLRRKKKKKPEHCDCLFYICYQIILNDIEKYNASSKTCTYKNKSVQEYFGKFLC